MSTPITTLVQQEFVDAEVELFQFDATPVGGSIMYFTDQVADGNEVSFGGQVYTLVRIDFQNMEVSGQGTLPNPTLQVYNDANNLVRTVANNIGALEGCVIKRLRTFRRYLDGQPEADPTAYRGPDIFVIDRKMEDTSEGIKWQLVSSIDSQGRKIPKRKTLRDSCLWRYRRWTGSAFDYSNVQCPYMGETSYDRNNNIVTNDQDECGRTVLACKARFGAGNALPFGGFPGIARGK